MTDNIFEIDTASLAHVSCAPRESGIILTFAASNPGVNHSWIFSVLERTELPEFIWRFLRKICHDSTTHVEFAGTSREQFLMDRRGSQGCPASGFLFSMVVDPTYRWPQDAFIPSNPAGLDFLQLVQCAYAADLAVAGLDDRVGQFEPICL